MRYTLISYGKSIEIRQFHLLGIAMIYQSIYGGIIIDELIIH
jgi:hypothetical protein